MIIYHAIHHESDSSYAFPISKNAMVVRLRVAKEDLFEEVNLVFGEKYSFHQKQNKISMKRKLVDKLFAYYEIVLELTDVRFVYIFELVSKEEKLFFSEDGITQKYDFEKSYLNCFQYSYINECDVYQEIEWVKQGVFYEIFVDRFHRGNYDKNDTYVNQEWGSRPNSKTFAGGDLKGVIEKLPYLEKLGITAIYLTPVFSSISNHKYDTNDYYKVDFQFGDEQDLHCLVNHAHRLGIKVILDGVFNHASDLLDKFQDVIKHGRKSPYFEWFIIKDDYIDLNTINYETFSSCYYHPKFNTSNKEVQDYLINIGKHYVQEFDIDGWRLDVSDEPSHSFWRKFREQIKAVKKDVFLVGENWHNAASYLRGDEFDGIMNYRFTKLATQFIAKREIDAQQMKEELSSLLIRNKEQANKMMLNLLDSHDTNRFFYDCSLKIEQLILGLALLFSFKGTPLIYYGTEIPLSGGYDPDNRRCMEFDKVDENGILFRILQKLISIRKSTLFSEGDISIDCLDDCLIITRFLSNEKICLIINNTLTAKRCLIKGSIVLSYNYENEFLQPSSFIIYKETEI